MNKGKYKAWKCNLSEYCEGKDVPSHFVFFSFPNLSGTWHSEGVGNDIRFLCIKPTRPVANDGLSTNTLTGRSCLTGPDWALVVNQKALRN